MGMRGEFRRMLTAEPLTETENWEGILDCYRWDGWRKRNEYSIGCVDLMCWSNIQVEIPSRQLVVSRAWEGIQSSVASNTREMLKRTGTKK